MDTTTTATDPTPAEYAAACGACAARGPLRCKRCGCYDVTWRKTNAGRWYLMAGNGRRAYSPPHKCESHARHSERSESHEAYYRQHQDHRTARS